MRVIVAHHVAHDLGRLAISTSGNEAAFLTGEKDPAMNRLETVADIGKRAADDHAHRVIEVARLHLVDDVDAAVLAFGSRSFQYFSIVAHALLSFFRCVGKGCHGP